MDILIKFCYNQNKEHNIMNIIYKTFRKVRRKISSKKRNYVSKYNLENDFSIISCNCLGGLMYHDLKMQFLSPTINLFIETPDFIKFCLNLNEYIRLELVEDKTFSKYPIGVLGDIKIHFLHYENFYSARTNWNKRKERINFDKIFVIISDRDNFNEDLLAKIDEIKYPKVLFAHKKYNDYTVFIEKDKNKKMVGDLTDYINFNGVRKYEYYFDFEKWFTGKYKSSECMIQHK